MRKEPICFLAGVLLGSVLGYYISKDVHEKKAQEEINNVRERFSKKLVAMKNDILKEKIDKETFEEVSYEYKGGDRVSPKGVVVMDNEEFKAKGFTNYESYSKLDSDYSKPDLAEEKDEPEVETDDDPEMDYTNYIPSYPKEGPRSDLYSITPEQFANELPWFDKETLIFYQKDHILATEDEEIITDFNFDYISHMGEYEDGVCYIRNEKVGCDYEIILEKGSFADPI